MIHRIYSDLDGFQELCLNPGLNVLLAEKSEEASDKQTRNGAGKTSLIELIHFVMGASAGPSSIFRTSTLAAWRFGLELDVGENRAAIERSGAEYGRLYIAEGDTSVWPIEPRRNSRTGDLTVSVKQWKSILASLFFHLPVDRDTSHGKFSPTFRSVFSYFARRHGAGGFFNHTTHSPKQQLWDCQVAISYLLGLDWSVSQNFQILREQEKTINQLKRSLKKGTIPGFQGSAASLRSQVSLAKAKAEDLKNQLDAFNVVPEYRSIERELAELTEEMNLLGNENSSDIRLINQLEGSLNEEKIPQVDDLGSLYEEVKIVLPDLITRHLEDATRFHRAIIRNRRAHLQSEIGRLNSCIAERDKSKKRIGQRRKELMQILENGGALEQYTLLQEEYSRLSAESHTLEHQLVTARRIESKQTKAEIERKQLKELLSQDFFEQEGILNDAIVLFEQLSQALYETERTGIFTVDATDNGPIFEVRIDAERSHGITNMQVFCFDLMLMVIASRQRISPKFLVHDSHLFDGVDERQVARALQLGSAFAKQYGFQYVVTLNSDALPQEGFDTDFDIFSYVNPIRLDDTPAGSLFGVRFN